MKNLNLQGISVHIGSQITSINPFKKVLSIINKIINKTKINFKFIYSGQHYDHRLSTQIINDLELPIPDFSLKLKSKKSCLSPDSRSLE